MSFWKKIKNVRLIPHIHCTPAYYHFVLAMDLYRTTILGNYPWNYVGRNDYTRITIVYNTSVFRKKVLDHADYYGQYIIDQTYFPGKQADWQYNTFRFEIKENDSLFFHITEGEKIIKTYKGSIRTTINHTSARLVINMEQPTHHILSTNPTTYREVWSFFMVFKSPKFNNLYFKKGKWKKIN